MANKIAIVIDDEYAWRREFEKALTQAGFQVEAFEAFHDNADAVLFLVNAQDAQGRVVGPEQVAALRVSHPEAIIIGTSADLRYVQPRATKNVQAQFHDAGTNYELDTTKYDRDEFLAQIQKLISE